MEVSLRGKKPYTKTVTLRPRENGRLFVDRFAPEVPEQRNDSPPVAQRSQQEATAGQDGAARTETAAQLDAFERSITEAERLAKEIKERNAKPPIDIVPADADKAGGVKFAGKHTTQNVIETMKSVAQRRGWTVVKVEGDVVMLNLKNRGYDATVFCRCSASGVEFISDSYRSGRVPLIGGKPARTVPSSWIDNLKDDVKKALHER